MAAKKDAAKKTSAENKAALTKWGEPERAVRERLSAFNEMKRAGPKPDLGTIKQRIVVRSHQPESTWLGSGHLSEPVPMHEALSRGVARQT